jgi:glycerophosphoryl diester phosphodiesterase
VFAPLVAPGDSRCVRWLALVLVLFAFGCGSSDGPEGAGGSAGGGAGGAATVLDPATFDCGASAPERTTLVPTGCATDPACATRLVTGHRGVGGDLGVIAPENTLAAVRAAIVLGVDFVETDPRATADGVLVNVHDDTVERTTDGTGVVSEMTLAAVQALAIDAGELAGDFSCERVPTIVEVLEAARGKVHVLLDANKTDRVDLLVEAVQQTDTHDWAVIDTDDVDKIDQALSIDPTLHIMVRVADQAELDTEIAHFASHPPVLIELHDGASPTELVPAVHAAGGRASINSFPTDLAAGIDGDESLYTEVFESGVDVVQSDRPDLVLRYLGR